MRQPIQLVLAGTGRLPALFTSTPTAAKRFVAFFTANIRNPNTRKAYTWAVTEFAAWCERHGLLSLPAIEPVHVTTYIESLQGRLAAPSIKQHLAAIRMLFDWLVVGQVLPSNPASSMRCPAITTSMSTSTQVERIVI
jgi:site-specific recombinase XerD